KIYCLDLRDHADPAVYLDEIRRIAGESAVQTVELMGWINGSPAPEQLQRYLNPVGLSSATNGALLDAAARENGSSGGNGAASNGLEDPGVPGNVAAAGEATRRRWYPVIDYSRCTNCMECIDFCLFGVYGVDAGER